MSRGLLAATLAGLLIAAPLLIVGAATADEPLRSARWLAPGKGRVAALTTHPAECLPKAARGGYAVEVGRAAFRTPLLLGGQAARAGVACETCHKAGRSNPDFLFPGVSGAPGTADVTNSLFSSHRGDGVDNPKPIPDLGAAKSALKVSQAREGRALETFIHGLITEEFDGPEPPPAVLDGLGAYVRALDPKACAGAGAISVAGYMDDAVRAVGAARQAIVRKDRATAALMVGAARSQLGLIYERYAAPDLAADGQALKSADHALAQAADAVRAGDRGADAQLQRWLAGSQVLAVRVRRDEPRSLFNPARLYPHPRDPARR